MAMEESRYSGGKVTPNTRIGIDDKGLFLYEENGTSFTRTRESKEEPRKPDERPEGLISTDFDGPDDFTFYYESKWLRRVTVQRDTLELIEEHYPPIKEHLPLRLFLQYILFNRHALKLNSTWSGKGTPLKATMLSRMAGRLEQYESNNFRVRDLLWWAKVELFDGEFSWTDWDWSPNPKKRRFRRVKSITIPSEIALAVEEEMSRPVSKKSDRVWFDTGNAYSAQSSADFRANASQYAQRHGEEILKQKGNPKVPRAIQSYLNGLPINGFNKVLADHIEDAYSVVDNLPEDSREQRLSKRNARTLLRFIEDCPKPFYQAKLKTPRLFAPDSMQLLNREVRDILIQDWTTLDLSSAQFAVCAQQWEIAPLLEFLNDDGDIWDELTSWMGLPKPPLKKALYAVIFGARVKWIYDNPPSTLNEALTDGSDLSAEQTEEARRRLLAHPLMSSLYEAREERIEEIQQAGRIQDCFGSVMELPSQSTRDANRSNTVLTLLSAELSALEMLLLWPAFEEVIESEDRCKIMLYLFDGISFKAATSTRTDLWKRKLQEAVNQKAKMLGIPTQLEVEETSVPPELQ